MKGKIIVINGVAESGKDTFVELVENHASVPVKNISSIDPVKDVMRACGWHPDNKSDEARECMAEMKKILIDKLDGPFWYISQKIDEIRYFDPEAIIFVHVREPGEIEKLKMAYGDQFLSVLIKKDIRVPDNIADSSVDGFEYDVIEYNNGSIRELELAALQFAHFVETGTWGNTYRHHLLQTSHMAMAA